MNLSITAVVAEKVGFASHQNAVPLIRELRVDSEHDGPVSNARLTLRADPPFLQERSWLFDLISPSDSIQVSDREVLLNATLLNELTESVTGTLHLELVSGDDVPLASASYPIELLAHNEWGGMSTMAELLPAFVMPNDPAVDQVLKAASDVLRRAGRPDGLDGYTAGSRQRAWELASAIWSAIAGLRLSYALPPASFETNGQKVRTPGAILEGRVATCLDTALLFAAALEQTGLNPLLVLTKGHAFAGVWLQPVEFSSLVTDEAAAMRRRMDVKDLILFETTLATNSPPAGFEQAIDGARRQLAESAAASFEMAIDVRRARIQKIRPLGVAVVHGAEPKVGAVNVAEALQAAPDLPAFDVEVEPEGAGGGDRIRQWQRKLLNLTTSNRLLNLPESGKIVRLHCPEPGALEDLLASGKRIRIQPMPDLASGGRDEKLYEQRTQENLRDDVARGALAKNEALSPLPKDKLEAALVDLYRKARTDLEEGGANTLFLALGFLKWKKSPTEQRVYRAPLVLVPVKLERKSALSGVVMVHHEDEPRFNLTLLELLRQDFQLEIPGLDGELSKDESGIDVDGIWSTVRRAIRDIGGFEVVPEVVLGTFSFAKYLMWKDLVDRADLLKESRLVRHLIDRDGEAYANEGGLPRAEELDVEVDPADLFTPLPADSSQLSAVLASARGRDFVLDGPPGTGKSQTIANMIAQNLAAGRRVLFVAEKKAALDVVHRRLTEKGLAPFCLELHSAKATKTEVLKQLDRAWTTRDQLSADEWRREALEVRMLRDDLNAVAAVLNRRAPNGLSVQSAIGRTVRDAGPGTPRFAFPPEAEHDADDMASFREAAKRLGFTRGEVSNLPSEMAAVARAEWTNGWQEAIVSAASGMPAVIDRLVEDAQGLLAATRLPLAVEDREELARCVALVRALLGTHGKDLRFAFAADFADKAASAREAAELLRAYRSEDQALSARYAFEAARRINVDASSAEWARAAARMWPFGSLARRRIAKELATAGGAAGKVEVASDLPRLGHMKEILSKLDALAAKLSGIPGWVGPASDETALVAAVELAERLRASIAAEAGGPEQLIELRQRVSGLVVDANELLGTDGPVAVALHRLEHALTAFEETSDKFAALSEGPRSADLSSLRAAADAIVLHQRRLNAWTNWQRAKRDAHGIGLAPLVDAIEAGAVEPAGALQAFEVGYAKWFAATRIDAEPLLSRFVASEQADKIERFREVDDRLAQLAVRYIKAKICGDIPSKEEAVRKDGWGVLKHQLQLQRAHKPIRQLATDMGDAFTQLAPCMLMSPLSIAQYLPADQDLFDLVIFDEASQITPWDAIGAMARGRQVVIAGDPRQMPPSNDFMRGSGGDEGDDDLEQDLDSILEECLAAGVPCQSLDWHYRSRHESLITFSNHRYYQSKLVTFPPPVTKSTAVTWSRVEGVYTRGAGGRTNPIEAQAIVDEAVSRLRDPNFLNAKGEPLTLGIITMNVEQMKLVEDILDKVRRKHPEIEPHFSDERLEPVVVRNLETAQGDERDVILIGIGFGPTEPGGKTMHMDFGKLNKQGGWRRLNVAVTRARAEMKVFTSFDPGMIDLARSSARAVADLKHFIQFADRGDRALTEAVRGSVGSADSPFEEAVAWELTRRGWTVVPQVGVSRFRIDLGVVHPDRTGDFLMGVECDGATYHSAATARDRDKVRQSILEDLGWKLARVWSTDWWIDAQGAADRLHAILTERLEHERLLAAEAEAERARRDAESSTQVEPVVPLVDAEPDDAVPVLDEAPREPVIASLTSAYASAAPSEAPSSSYRLTDFAQFAAVIDPERFYDDAYQPILAALVDHVLICEAPISSTLLVQRIARAHGFQRAGGQIRKRVLAMAKANHCMLDDSASEPFVWRDALAPATWRVARLPHGDDDIRQVEEIALAELRAAANTGGDPVEIARRFGIRRLSAAARARVELALIEIQDG